MKKKRDHILFELAHVGLTFDVAPNYPYAPPYQEPYPYNQTLDAARLALAFLYILHGDKYCWYNDQLNKFSENTEISSVELKQFISILLQEVENFTISGFSDLNSFFNHCHTQVLSGLSNLAEIYPYRSTLDAIKSTLVFFDAVERCSPSKANLRADPVYFLEHYLYQLGDVFNNTTRAVLIPTVRELSLADFIKVRSVPIGFLGVTTEVKRADNRNLSPLEFFVHDANHFRLVLQHNEQELKARQSLTRESEFYFIVNLLLLLEIIF